LRHASGHPDQLAQSAAKLKMRIADSFEFAGAQHWQEWTNGFRRTLDAADTGRMANQVIHNGHQVVTFNASTSVENEHHQTFTFRIEARMIRDMRFPLLGRH